MVFEHILSNDHTGEAVFLIGISVLFHAFVLLHSLMQTQRQNDRDIFIETYPKRISIRLTLLHVYNIILGYPSYTEIIILELYFFICLRQR